MLPCPQYSGFRTGAQVPLPCEGRRGPENRYAIYKYPLLYMFLPKGRIVSAFPRPPPGVAGGWRGRRAAGSARPRSSFLFPRRRPPRTVGNRHPWPAPVSLLPKASLCRGCPPPFRPPASAAWRAQRQGPGAGHGTKEDTPRTDAGPPATGVAEGTAQMETGRPAIAMWSAPGPHGLGKGTP